MASAKNKGEKETVDDAVFDEYTTQYEDWTYAYFSAYVKSIASDTRLAFQIAKMLDKTELGLTELSNVFPIKKRKHQQRVDTYNGVKNPLKKRQKEIEDEISDLYKQIDLFRHKHNDPEAAPLVRRLNEKSLVRNEIAAKLTALKEPRKYQPRYEERKDKQTGEMRRPRLYEPDWAFITDWLDVKRKRYSYKTNPVFKNLDIVCDYFNIGKLERAYLNLIVLYEIHSGFKNLVDKLSFSKPEGYRNTLAKMLGIDTQALQDLSDEKSPLLSTRIIIPADDGDKEKHLPNLNPFLMRVLSAREMTLEQFTDAVIGRPVDPKTIGHVWDVAFDDIETTDRHIMEGLLSNAQPTKTQGVNILFYGMQDTGKTTAAKTLGKHLGKDVYLLGEKSSKNKNDSKEISADERLGRIVMAQSLLRNQPNALLVVDECEHLMPRMSIMELFGGSPDEKTSGRKLFINRLLEENEIPTLWIANDAGMFIAPVRRRFSFSYEFGIPSVRKRKEIWLERAKTIGVELTEADAHALAKRYRGPAGMTVVALKNVKVANSSPIKQTPEREISTKAIIEASIREYSRLVFDNPRAVENDHVAPDKFDSTLMNVTVEDCPYDMVTLTKKLSTSPHKNFSILAWGPPGGGKDAYACWLAEQLGMEVMYRRASDILSKYHGETEHNMRAMFEESKKSNAFLHMAEADQFFMDRRRLEYSWMIPMIEEMLTNLESHPLPCLFSTNLVDYLDPASKRRMTFKLKFDFLQPDQARRAFRLYFDRTPPTSLDGISKLSSGDFANVARQIRFMDDTGPDDIVRMLDAEVRAKLDQDSGYSDSHAGFRGRIRGLELRQLPKIDDTIR